LDLAIFSLILAYSCMEICLVLVELGVFCAMRSSIA
jgi:hypothetical protein